MHQQPADPRCRAAREFLFTPPVRLGWIYRSRRDLISPYPEPEPDPEAIRQQTAARAAAAERSYQRARKWAARPSLMLAMVLLVLAGCERAAGPGAHAAGTLLGVLIVCGPGLAWTGWCWHRRSQAKAADPVLLHQQARQEWEDRAATHEQAELDRLAEVPEWASAELRMPRTDVYGGTLAGWGSLLTVHGASILARHPLLVADLTGQFVLAELAALARHARIPSAEWVLPRDLGRAGLLTRLSGQQLADALAEAIHAGPPGTARTDRAVDVRVLEQLCAALAGHGGVTPARLAAAVQTALGRPVKDGLLSAEEKDLIGGKLFGESYQAQIGVNLVRLDAFLAGLARYAGTGPAASPRTAYCTLLATGPGARSAHGELLAALVIQWLTVEVTASTAAAPAVVIAGADEITRPHLERLADACDRRNVPLTLMFRHLRDDAISMAGGGNTVFMRLGNHHEAEQAAAFIGRDHKFVLSGFTATMGGSHNVTRGEEHGYGTSQSRGTAATHGWSEDGFPGSGSYSGSRSRSREYGRSENWGSTTSHSDGTEWNDATSCQRVYEYRVEPGVLQSLPENALLLVTHNNAASPIQAVECHPAITTMPHVSMDPLQHGPPPAAVPPQPRYAQQNPRRLQPRQHQPHWPLPAGDEQPAASWRRGSHRR